MFESKTTQNKKKYDLIISDHYINILTSFLQNIIYSFIFYMFRIIFSVPCFYFG